MQYMDPMGVCNTPLPPEVEQFVPAKLPSQKVRMSSVFQLHPFSGAFAVKLPVGVTCFFQIQNLVVCYFDSILGVGISEFQVQSTFF